MFNKGSTFWVQGSRLRNSDIQYPEAGTPSTGSAGQCSTCRIAIPSFIFICRIKMRESEAGNLTGFPKTFHTFNPER